MNHRPQHFRQRETVCPQCGSPLDSLSQAGGVVEPGIPQPGDLSLCLQCRSLLELTGIGAYRVMTGEEIATLRDDERLDLEATHAFLEQYDAWKRQQQEEQR